VHPLVGLAQRDVVLAHDVDNDDAGRAAHARPAVDEHLVVELPVFF